MKRFLVSTADVEGFDENDNLLFRGTSMLDTSIETSLGSTEVRGGRGNKLLYVYYHTSEMNITITNAEFSLDFLALNVGSNIEVGADMFIDETVSIEAGEGSVKNTTPLSLNTEKTYGWVTLKDGTIVRTELTNGAFKLDEYTSYTDDACVRYYGKQISAREVTVYADMMPSNIRLVMEATLGSSDSTTSKIGKIQVHVPRASMTGAFTLSMTPDAVSSTPLNVRALAYDKIGAKGGCEGNKPIYAEIIELIDNTNWYDNVIALAIEGGAISMVEGDTKALKIYAIRNDGSAPFLVPTDKITISSGDAAIATVTGLLVTAEGEGNTLITATITDKTEINTNVAVVVTAA